MLRRGFWLPRDGNHQVVVTSDRSSISRQAEGRDETEDERRDRNLAALMQELRVAFPGVQILFAFLLVVPFQAGWPDVTESQRTVYFVTLLLTACSSICFIAPTADHRIRFRDRDLEWVIRTSNRLMVAGLALLAAAFTGGTMLVTMVVFSTVAAIVVAAAIAMLIGLTWFGIPLARKRQADGRTGGRV
jgi:Family of unknown function (DUF6328)